MASTNIPKVAVLDDTQRLAEAHFSKIPVSKADITYFHDTLPPYGHPTTSEADTKAIIDRLKPFEILSTMRERTPFPAELFEQLPNLKLLIVTGARHTSFNTAAAKEKGLTVAAALGHGRKADPKAVSLSMGGAHSTTQVTWALILGLGRGIAREDHALKTGLWQTGVGVGTAGKTLGILGLGRLGATTARIGVIAFGTKVLVWSANMTQERADEEAKRLGLPTEVNGEKVFKAVSKDEIFKDSDIVSLHYPLTEHTRGMIGKHELGLMKPTAMFINTSRGPLVEEAALVDTLEKGKILGAALDVFDVEPLQKDHPYRSYKWGTEGRSELLISPHMGYVEKETLDLFYAESADVLEKWLDTKEVVHRM
jgi:phosphoglycerate dehydrogenase-like enzyme